MLIKIFNFFTLLLFTTPLLAVAELETNIATNPQEQHQFVKSFVSHYDARTASRYTHEYHKHILTKTAQSFLSLEQKLRSENINACGRIVVTGYEEGAFPSYYTNYKKESINDEAFSKNKTGWSQQLHNKFGFLTGFLFKDVNEILKKTENPTYLHINPELVELFDENSSIFQEHAFGESYDLLLEYKNILEKKLKKQDHKNILKILKAFWEDIYSREFKTNSNQLAATQDILFSIEYANYLMSSNLPLFRYYTGPDITYPIEQSIKQKKGATKHSQKFVPIFLSNLQAINNEPTVYIFCSFVDGVGKSTMLGNVKNWMDFGDDIEKYERTDNSSSQFAEVFKFQENIFIADLPAQVSHFTYKPDGLVYTDFESELKDTTFISEIRTFIQQNKDFLFNSYFENAKKIELELIAARFSQEKFLADVEPETKFIQNLFLLKKINANGWIPFTFKNEHFLFNILNQSQVRILRPLCKVSSYGLKNVDVEQMIFTQVNFPASFDIFLNDFTAKLKEQNIKNAVFVDFMSMYPRSSRENIRVNYLLYQLALLNQNFDIEHSFYKNFISEAQLFAHLNSKQEFPLMAENFREESFLRLALFEIIDRRKDQSFEAMLIDPLSKHLTMQLSEFQSNTPLSRYNEETTFTKLEEERENLGKTFNRSKEYLSIWQFNFQLLDIFSKQLTRIFTEMIHNENLNQLWSDFDGEIIPPQQTGNLNDGKTNKTLELTNQQKLLATFEFSSEFRSEEFLTPFIRTLRTYWYSTLANLLFCQNNQIGKLKYPVVPTIVKHEPKTNRFYLVQKLLPLVENEKMKGKTLKTFGLTSNLKFAFFEENTFLQSFTPPTTNCGIFSFDLSYLDQKSNPYFMGKTSIVNQIIKEFQKEYGANKAILTSELYEKLQSNAQWRKEIYNLKMQAQRSGEYNSAQKQNTPNVNPPIFLGAQSQISGAQLFVLAIATLEMILKDPDCFIAARKGNKKDFIATIKLLELVTLPKHFHIIFAQPLFENYETLQPLFPWEYFEN
ncbi:TPA: hypothetical protein DEO28_04175 [Candidatus Dependentiae bacterium]|nr:MAG: hypothetical protein UR14_C0006G0072 [candidate division TM6 bacterium GW2011_GWE2_31_21]KKP53505.1 MAG: hypothetical protein UR43_C0004G0046 [candidate division TM6 bacterium GW2011_GWF2_33_332]HBS48254.1 hypothetical protein [Candidatus Dependentiae bacterium]HBZ73680.1 hypothetical protein [Candidatus Dependentiae bacterium]